MILNEKRRKSMKDKLLLKHDTGSYQKRDWDALASVSSTFVKFFLLLRPIRRKFWEHLVRE